MTPGLELTLSKSNVTNLSENYFDDKNLLHLPINTYENKFVMYLTSIIIKILRTIVTTEFRPNLKFY